MAEGESCQPAERVGNPATFGERAGREHGGGALSTPASRVAGGGSRRFPWSRGLSPRSAIIRLGPDGYPFDHRGEHAELFQPGVISIRNALPHPVLAVLGEAGIGKSDVLRTVALEAGADEVLDVDLGLFGDLNDLNREIFESEKWKRWQEGTHRLRLILDSLDEAMIGVANVVGLLQRRLTDLPFTRLQIVISCRSAAWPETLAGHLQRQIGESASVGLYEVVPLSGADVAVAAEASGIDAAAFLDAVDQLDGQPLASNPASLRLLLDLYATKSSLPPTREALYEQGLTVLAEDTPDRRDRGNRGGLTAGQLLEVAGRIAAVMLFSGRASVFMGAGVAPANSVVESDVIGGEEGDDGLRVAVTRDALEVALQTGLFSGRGPRLVGFAHKSYAEFLAARHIARSRLTDAQRYQLLYAPDERRLVPQLQETAAWLAGMDPHFRDQVLQLEPEVLLTSDVAAQDPEARARLVTAYLDRIHVGHVPYELRRAHIPYYARLSHPGIDGLLRAVITDPARSSESRSAAADIAGSCGVGAIAGDLADVVLDEASPMQLRIRTAYALGKLDVPTAHARLKPLAFGDENSDPMDELRGRALAVCWPAHMTAVELFRALRPPRVRNFHGSYAGFLWKSKIVGALRASDLPAALEWAEELGEHGHDDLERIAGGIAVRAWNSLGEPGVSDGLARLLLRRYRAHECPFHIEPPPEGGPVDRQDDSRLVRDFIARDPATRRSMIFAVVPILGLPGDAWVLVAGDTPLVLHDDFEWLLGQALGTSEAATALAWAQLARFSFNASRLDHVEAWLAIRGQSPALDAELNFPLVLHLESPEGRKVRADRLPSDARGRTGGI